MTSRRAALLTATLLALAACDDGGGASPPPGSGGEGGGGPCDGVTSDCSNDDECGDAELCGDCGVCAPDPGSGACTGTGDCAPGHACREQRCVRSVCAERRDCADGEACTGGRCVPGDCTNLGCPGSLQCRPSDGACVPCILDRHCDDAFYPVCDEGPGRCVQCRADGDCTTTPARDRCSPALTCVECVEDLDCAAPTGRCGAAHRCVACATDADCPGSVCRADGSCDPGPEAGESCRADGTCAAGFSCVGEPGLCREACAPYDPRCPAGHACAVLGAADGAIAMAGDEPAGACLPDDGSGAQVGQVCDDARPCHADLLCVPIAPDASLCRLPCDPALDPALRCAPPAEACVALPVGSDGAPVGVCSPPTTFLQSCASDADCDVGLGCGPRLEQGALALRCGLSAGLGDATGPCTVDEQCRSGLCLSFADGAPAYCFAACSDAAPCAGDGRCGSFSFDVEGGTQALEGCQPSCTTDADCAAFGAFTCGLGVDEVALELFGQCQPTLGAAGPGDACALPADCATGLCRAGAGLSFCLGGCEADADCGQALSCRAVAFRVTPDGVEPPAFDDVRICWGATCATDADCPTGACRPEIEPADPTGAYRLSCDVATGAVGAGGACTIDDDCRSGICFSLGGPTSLCYGPCEGDGDCTNGSACQQIGFLTADGGTAILPACLP